MMSTRASRGIAVVLATLTLLSFSTAVAFAAPATTTWSAERPARGAVVSAPVAEEGVTVSCTADLVGSTRQFLVDGVSSWSLYTNPAGGGHAVWSELWDDDAESWTSGWVWTTTPDLTRGTLSASRAIGADGSHTVSVTLGNSSGTSSTDTWTFSVRIPPTLGAPTPAPGSSVNATNPVIEIPAADNSAVTSWTATLNGAPVASTFDSVTGKVRLTLPAALSNDSVDTVVVSVFDALGLRTDRTWSFTVQTYPEMTGQLPSCTSCHPNDAGDPDMGAVCGNCHQTNHVGVPSALHIKADVSACSPCHVSDLTVEHARHISSKGVAVTCVDCHASTDPKVVSAIASKNSACSGCHTFVNHLTQHEVTAHRQLRRRLLPRRHEHEPDDDPPQLRDVPRLRGPGCGGRDRRAHEGLLGMPRHGRPCDAAQCGESRRLHLVPRRHEPRDDPPELRHVPRLRGSGCGGRDRRAQYELFSMPPG